MSRQPKFTDAELFAAIELIRESNRQFLARESATRERFEMFRAQLTARAAFVNMVRTPLPASANPAADFVASSDFIEAAARHRSAHAKISASKKRKT